MFVPFTMVWPYQTWSIVAFPGIAFMTVGAYSFIAAELVTGSMWSVQQQQQLLSSSSYYDPFYINIYYPSDPSSTNTSSSNYEIMYDECEVRLMSSYVVMYNQHRCANIDERCIASCVARSLLVSLTSNEES